MDQIRGGDGGAITGPTIAGCSYDKTAHRLQLSFNASLLGGEGLLLRPFDFNASNWAPEPDWAGPGPIHDSLGLMVCAANATRNSKLPGAQGVRGNASTCECVGWNYFKYNGSDPQNPGAWWYCEVGPGFKPPPETIRRERRERQALLTFNRRRRRHALAEAAAMTSQGQHAASTTSMSDTHALLPKEFQEGELIVGAGVRVGRVPEANPFQHQWQPTPLILGGDQSKVTIDLSPLNKQKPLAVRLAWVLFDAPDQSADTCCPSADSQQGRKVCLPGNCPLYSAVSELPANPFFATIDAVRGRCVCPAPQVCDSD